MRKRNREGREGSGKTERNTQTEDVWPRPKTKRPVWRQRGMSVRKLCLLLALSAFLALTIALGTGSGMGQQSGLGEDSSANVSLQNEKIAVFSGSSFWEPFPPELGKILGREVEFFFHAATTTAGALSSCNGFESNKFGVIIVGFGGQDRLDGLSWEQTESSLREIFRRLKRTGAVVVYNQLVPDHSGFGPG